MTFRNISCTSSMTWLFEIFRALTQSCILYRLFRSHLFFSVATTSPRFLCSWTNLKFSDGTQKNVVTKSGPWEWGCCTARSVEDETWNAKLNGNRNPECWGDFSQPVKIEKIKNLGISRYKVELRFWLDLKSEVSRGTNSNWDFRLMWICSWLKSPHHSGFRLPFNSAFRVSSSTERAVPRSFSGAGPRYVPRCS